MATYWFVSAPLFSHTDWGGYLKTAQALQGLGHQVIWVSGSALANVMQNAGIEFAEIEQTGWLWPPPPLPDTSTLTPQQAITLRYTRALDTWMTEDLVRQGTQNLIDLAERIGKPDVIVTDPFVSAAALAAEKIDVPLVVCGWLAMDDLDAEILFPVQRALGEESQRRMQSLYEHFGLEGRYFSHGPTPAILSPYLHIAYFTRDWFVAEESALLEQNEFVGGMPTPPVGDPPSWLTDIPEDVPMALITLGTTFTGDLGFFSWAAHAAHRAGLIPLVVIGYNPISNDKKQELIRALPKGSRLLSFVPFDHVLPRVKLMFHHGGMGTTHAAVVHGVMQIVVPHAADQRAQARRVAQAKVGFNLSAHDVRNGKLLEGALALVNNEEVQKTADQLAQDMANLGGPPRAAELLVEVLDK